MACCCFCCCSSQLSGKDRELGYRNIPLGSLYKPTHISSYEKVDKALGPRMGAATTRLCTGLRRPARSACWSLCRKFGYRLGIHRCDIPGCHLKQLLTPRHDTLGVARMKPHPICRVLESWPTRSVQRTCPWKISFGQKGLAQTEALKVSLNP